MVRLMNATGSLTSCLIWLVRSISRGEIIRSAQLQVIIGSLDDAMLYEPSSCSGSASVSEITPWLGSVITGTG
jgi:hypothetical protein